MEKRIEDQRWDGESTRIEREELSDGSIVFNVVFRGPHLKFGCTSEREARDLAGCLERCSWVEAL